MLSTKQITQLILDSDRRGTVGAAASRHRALREVRDSGRGAPKAQWEFTRAMQELNPATRQKYTHPGFNALAASKELSPADLVWLQRLPRDPAEVPWDDAHRVAKMDAGVRSQSGKSGDRHLVRSIWEPIRQFHDRKEAEVRLANSRLPLPEIPGSALNALVEAIRVEVPDLTDSEVLNRASDALRGALQERSARREQQASEALTTIADIEAARRERLSPTR